MNPPTTNPVGQADVMVLMVVLARYEAAVRGGDVDDHGLQRLADQCADVGLLEGPGPHRRADVAEALSDIGLRLRYAIGEHSSDPTAAG
ncbi:hypothetical protein [Nocardioides sp. J54]|uniref:hypothetical protein n=1 Tax=Nocardioides sp. J54 TaxID=935866 RepID=UPI0012F87090|nr:hypothetical protein [Nocardioides sp. J54]